MSISATIVLAPSFPRDAGTPEALCLSPGTDGTIGGRPVVCIELLGNRVLDCVVQNLQRTGVKSVTVVAPEEFCLSQPANYPARMEPVPEGTDPWSPAELSVREAVGHGFERVLLYRLGAYVELDYADLVRSHCAAKHGLTAAEDTSGDLDIWVINARLVADSPAAGLTALLDMPGAARYFSRAYSNRLKNALDARKLVVDALEARCNFVPVGREVKPGVWVDHGVRLHREARIDAPAYLGRSTTLRSQAVIGPCSSVEHGCDVGEGTIVENASVMANTYLGRGLHVSEAMVDGRNLIALRHGTVVEIEDRQLLGRTSAETLSLPITAASRKTSLAERLLELKLSPNLKQA